MAIALFGCLNSNSDPATAAPLASASPTPQEVTEATAAPTPLATPEPTSTPTPQPTASPTPLPQHVAKLVKEEGCWDGWHDRRYRFKNNDTLDLGENKTLHMIQVAPIATGDPAPVSFELLDNGRMVEGFTISRGGTQPMGYAINGFRIYLMDAFNVGYASYADITIGPNECKAGLYRFHLNDSVDKAIDEMPRGRYGQYEYPPLDEVNVSYVPNKSGVSLKLEQITGDDTPTALFIQSLSWYPNYRTILISSNSAAPNYYGAWTLKLKQVQAVGNDYYADVFVYSLPCNATAQRLPENYSLCPENTMP